jgi:hypothetical protein
VKAGHQHMIRAMCVRYLDSEPLLPGDRRSAGSGLDCMMQHLGHIDVLPDDCGALATQLQGDGLDVFAGGGADDAADLGAARERNLRPDIFIGS